MINYIVTDTELTATADAIRTKGGTSALIPWQAGTGFADAVGAIPSGGGASLPSIISKIDGGSFTVAEDTVCEDLNIATQLGTPAAAFTIWSDDLSQFETLNHKGLILASVNLSGYASSDGVQKYGSYAYIQRQTNGSTYLGHSSFMYSNERDKFSNDIRINYYKSDTYYIAGKVYNWLAWA